MLSQGMNADDDMGTPAFEKIRNVTDGAGVEKVARLGSKTIDGPIEILHPMLLVLQHPVVNAHQLFGYRMGVYEGPHNAHRIRLRLKEALHTRSDSRRGRAMPTAGIGRDNQNFRKALRSH